MIKIHRKELNKVLSGVKIPSFLMLGDTVAATGSRGVGLVQLDCTDRALDMSPSSWIPFALNLNSEEQVDPFSTECMGGRIIMADWPFTYLSLSILVHSRALHGKPFP